MGERPDKHRRKELRDPYKATHGEAAPLALPWWAHVPVLVWMLPQLIASGFALGVITAASGLMA